MKKIKKIIMILFAFLSIVLFPFSIYASDQEREYKNELSADKLENLEKFIQENRNKGKIPGLSVTIVKGEETVYNKNFGYSNKEEQNLVDDDSLFEIGSNSKAFTAVGILNLNKDGRIELDDSIDKYIPWFKVKYKGNEVKITIKQLMEHTSGIPYNSIDKIPISNEVNALEDTIHTFIGLELDSLPGEKFQYASINYDILGLVIEKVSKMSYENYIDENVLKVMDLNNTYLFREDSIIEQIATGYKIQYLESREYEAPIYRGNKPAGYIISCGKDMAKWIKIQLETLPFTMESLRNTAVFYTAGWFIQQNNGIEISHGGNNPNYSSYILLRPEDKIGIAVLANMNSQYVESITKGIYTILQGEEFNIVVKDLNIIADKISLIIIIVSLFIIVTILFFIRKNFKEIIKRQRSFNGISIKSLIQLIGSLLFIGGISYCIYLIPNILIDGISWKFVFVWLPKSVEIALYLVYITIWLLYFYTLFTSFYKKKENKGILVILILSIASGLGNSLVIFTINMAISSSNTVKIKLLIFFILGILIYVYGQKIMRKKLIKLTNEMVYQKRIEIVEYLLKSNYKQFEAIEKGSIESTLNNDTETISRFTNILISGITNSITLICCFIYLGYINFYAFLLSIIIILFITSIYFFAGQYANKIGEEARDLQNTFFKFIHDLIGGFKELSMNEKKKTEFRADMNISCSKYKDKRVQASMAFANMYVIGELLFTLAIGIIALIFPLIIKNLGNTSVSSYVFILLYMTGPVHGILDIIPNSIEVRISIRRINELLKQILNVKNDSFSCVQKNNITLKLNQVEYVYNKNEERSFRIGPIDYEFKSGEIVFITGGNGSGKSTLANILTGIYTPTKGFITINNEKILSKTLSEHCSAIFGDFYLFDKLYGIDYKEKEKEIKKYLILLQLEEKVQIVNGKFSTIKLSSGQKKRLGLLVAYLEDKPIYLFDEWAADQDPQFRLFFYNTLLQDLKKKGKCIMAVTHDNQYFYLADKVIKMELGTIQ